MTRLLLSTTVGDRHLNVVATDRDDGDTHPVRVDASTLGETQFKATGHTWAMVDQVHGVEVRRVEGDEVWAATLGVADVLSTTALHAPVAVWAADCAPIVLAADDGTLVAAHAGWRGLAGGVIEVAVAAATERGGNIVASVLGPVIHPCCYAFGAADLTTIAGAVENVTRRGELALDVPATVARQMNQCGVVLDVEGPCTGCDDRWFSHRRRNDRGRHSVVAWWEAA